MIFERVPDRLAGDLAGASIKLVEEYLVVGASVAVPQPALIALRAGHARREPRDTAGHDASVAAQ